MKKILLILVLVWFGTQLTEAQRPPVWRYWRTADGLDSPWCYTADYSPLGNLVVCHSQGRLSLLDGYTVQTIDLPISIRGNTGVRQDEYGGIWLLDTVHSEDFFSLIEKIRGFYRYDSASQIWTHHVIPEEYQSDNIEITKRVFVSHQRNHVLFAHPTGLIDFDTETDRAEMILSATEAGIPRFETLIERSNAGGYWIAYPSGVLHLWNEGTDDTPVWRCKTLPFPGEFLLIHLIGLYENQKGDLFVNGFPRNYYDPYTCLGYRNESWQRVTDQFKDETEIGFEDRRGRIWLSLKDNSIRLIDGGRVKEIEGNDVLGTQIICKIVTDNEHAFYMTQQGIVNYMPPLWDRPTFLEANVYQNAKLVNVDDSGRIWIISDMRLYRIDGEDVVSYPIPKSRNQQVQPNFHLFSDGRLYVGFMTEYQLNGTERYRLILFDPRTEKFSTVEHPQRALARWTWVRTHPRKSLMVMTKDENDIRSLEAFDGNQFTVLGTDEEIPELEQQVSDVLLRENGDLWISTFEMDGPTLYRRGERVNFDTYDKGPFFSVLHFYDPGNGKLWAGGWNVLAGFDGESWKEILFHADGSRDALVSSNGDVWVACGNGVWRRREGIWTFMNYEDGLPTGRTYSVTEDNRGRIWIYSVVHGLYVYHPDADTDPPQTFLDPKENLREFAPNQDIRFVYSGIDKWKYTDRSRLLYSYQLDNKGWEPYTKKTVAAFHDVSYGDHTFQVRAMDMNNNVDASSAAWEFSVLRPWYLEPKFLLILIAGSGLIVMFAGAAINRHRKLNHYSHELEITNTQLNSMNAELQEANAQLMQLDQMKSAFVSQASHDLRTPLTAIKGSLDNLVMGIAGELNEKQTRVMQRATKSVDRLTNLVNDVLDLSRIESGRIVLEKSNIPFNILVENTIAENKPASDQKHIGLISNLGSETIMLRIDGGKIERVVGELISNAIKYTPENGTVEISLTKDNSNVSLFVKDSGIGMTDEECEKIWERFYRTTASKKFAKGSGLGLSIAKELVELHRGSIELISERGRGTTFTLSLPIKED